MRGVIWCDVETTGLKTDIAGAFQFGFIGVTNFGKKTIHKRKFLLNPLGGNIIYNAEAGKIHGISENEIKTYPKESEIIPNIVKFLEQVATNFGNQKFEKTYFCGYNPSFDWDFLDAALKRNGYKLEDYCDFRVLDVMQQVKKAINQGKFERLENLKLTTVAKSLGIQMNNAHDALCDITTTREISGKLSVMGFYLL